MGFFPPITSADQSGQVPLVAPVADISTSPSVSPSAVYQLGPTDTQILHGVELGNSRAVAQAQNGGGDAGRTNGSVPGNGGIRKSGGVEGGAAPSTPAELRTKIESVVRSHVKRAIRYGLRTMEPEIKDGIQEVYGDDERRFAGDFANVVVRRLRQFNWESGILRSDSREQVADFELENVNGELDVGKDIVVGATFVEASIDSVYDTLYNTANFTNYGSYTGVGIMKASQCKRGYVTIKFGNGFLDALGQEVVVVNQNRNLLRQKGVQYWRMPERVPGGCPSIKNIETNIGIQTIIPYEPAGGPSGYVVIYTLMSTPDIQLGSSPAMEATLDSIEKIAESKE